jgi:nucleotide-binding universal stress UspA family protein
MYRAIVVGTDGSDTAATAVAHAIEMATLSGATLHIVNAHQPVASGGVVRGDARATSALRDANATVAQESTALCALAAAPAESAGVTTESHSVPGDAADAILEVARAVGADLVVVGNQGMTGMKRFVLGSVPNKVSHHSSCSVLIVQTTDDRPRSPS